MFCALGFTDLWSLGGVSELLAPPFSHQQLITIDFLQR